MHFCLVCGEDAKLQEDGLCFTCADALVKTPIGREVFHQWIDEQERIVAPSKPVLRLITGEKE